MSEIPKGKGLQQDTSYWDAVAATTDKETKDYMLFYFTYLRPFYRDICLDETSEYEVDVIDTWNMTIENKGIFKGKFRVVLGGKPYMAIRMKKVK
jgi:hypothetical protein